MSKSLWKTDVTMSFTEKDAAIAKQLAAALRRHKLSVYHYKDLNHFGFRRDRILSDRYSEHIQAGLIIFSNDYLKSEWCRNEMKNLQQAYEQGNIKRLFVVEVGKTPRNKRIRSVIIEKWRNNPQHIAKNIDLTLRQDFIIHPKNSKKLSAFIGILLVVLTLLFAMLVFQ